MNNLQQLLDKYRQVDDPAGASADGQDTPAADPGGVLVEGRSDPSGSSSGTGTGKPIARANMAGKQVPLYIGTRVKVSLDWFPDEPTIQKLKAAFCIRNPEHKKAMRFPKNNQLHPPEPYLYAYEVDGDNYIALPRASVRWLIDFLQARQATVELIDQTAGVPLKESVQLADHLERWPEAVSALFEKRFGIYVGQRGEDRRLLAARVIVARSQRTLIVVKRKRQLYQWRDDLQRFTSFASVDIGLVGDGQCVVDTPIVVAIDRSLWRRMGDVGDCGQIVIDRCDLVNMKIFHRAVGGFRARYILGLAGHDRRGDGLTRMMTAFCGPVRYKEPIKKTPTAIRPIVKVRVCAGEYSGEVYESLIEQLVANQQRNEQIVTDILSVVGAGGQVIVLSVRLDHLRTLQSLLQAQYRQAELICGKTKPAAIERMEEAFKNQEFPVLLTTTKTISTLNVSPRAGLAGVVAAPFAYRDTAANLVHCLPDGGPDSDPGILFDYQDDHSFFQAALSKRLAVYQELGCQTP